MKTPYTPALNKITFSFRLLAFVLCTALTAPAAMAQGNGNGNGGNGNGCNYSPRPITGNQAPCPGSLETYCIDNDRGYTSFVWDVPRAHAGNPPIGWEIVSGQGTNCVTVRVGTKSGTMKVTVTDPVCGTKVATLPVKPANGFSVEVSGPDTVCFDVDQTYTAVISDSIKGNGNGNGQVKGSFEYTWTVPADWTITSGQGTQEINVIPGVTPGQVRVAVAYLASGNGNGNGVGQGKKGYCNSNSTDAMDVVIGDDCGIINPLPVELISFTGKADRTDAELTWVTASETNNDKFMIERSLNGREFSTVGEVSGQGTTTHSNNYSFTDKGGLNTSAAKVYYRLKQIDLDGSSDFSNIIAISAGQTDLEPVSVSPNPAQDMINVSFTNDATMIRAIDQTGRIVLEKQMSATSGNNAQINVSQLQSGVYILQVANGDKMQQVKFIKQ
jgi:hypothetical protein